MEKLTQPFRKSQNDPASDQGPQTVRQQWSNERGHTPQQHATYQYILRTEFVRPATT